MNHLLEQETGVMGNKIRAFKIEIMSGIRRARIPELFAMRWCCVARSESEDNR